MPLHNWNQRSGWDGLHHLWITELLRWIKPRLPEGYRAYIGSAPAVAIGSPSGRADVSVRQWNEPAPPVQAAQVPDAAIDEPDEEIAVATLDPGKALYIEQHGKLVSAVELISPRNKDRPVARNTYLSRYVGYIFEGVHLLLVDVHTRPIEFSFADEIANQLEVSQVSLPVPFAVSYRVGEPAATGGRLLAIWRRPLSIDNQLPTIPLPITVDVSVSVDLEQTYNQAASDAYLTE